MMAAFCGRARVVGRRTLVCCGRAYVTIDARPYEAAEDRLHRETHSTMAIVLIVAASESNSADPAGKLFDLRRNATRSVA